MGTGGFWGVEGATAIPGGRCHQGPQLQGAARVGGSPGGRSHQ